MIIELKTGVANDRARVRRSVMDTLEALAPRSPLKLKEPLLKNGLRDNHTIVISEKQVEIVYRRQLTSQCHISYK